jgi:hypothetical protein
MGKCMVELSDDCGFLALLYGWPCNIFSSFRVEECTILLHRPLRISLPAMAGPASQAFTKAMTTFITSPEGQELFKAELASYLQKEWTTITEALKKGMEVEVQREVQKEVEEKIKGEVQRVQDQQEEKMKEEFQRVEKELLAILQDQLGKLTGFGNRLQGLEDGLKEKVTKIVGRAVKRLEVRAVLVDKGEEGKGAEDAPAQAVDLTADSDKPPEPEEKGGQGRGQKRSREKTKASRGAGVGERTQSKRRREQVSGGDSQQSLRTAAAALAAEQAAQAQVPTSRTSSPRASVQAPAPSAAGPSRPGPSKVCQVLLLMLMLMLIFLAAY